MKWLKKPEEELPAVTHKVGVCIAHGCPGVGSIGTGPYFCRYHHGTDSSAWQSITHRLRQRGWLVNAVNVAFTLSDFDWFSNHDSSPRLALRAYDLCRGKGRPELAPMEERELRPGVVINEMRDPRLWAYRMNGFLMAECVGDSAGVSESKERDEFFAKVGHLIRKPQVLLDE